MGANKVLLGTWQRFGSDSKSTCSSYVPLWLPLVVTIITRSCGPHARANLSKAHSPPLSGHKQSPGGFATCRYSRAWSPFSFWWLFVKVVGISFHRVNPVPQLKDFEAISQHHLYHLQRNWGTEEIVCPRSPHYNVTQKKILFSSHKTGKRIL